MSDQFISPNWHPLLIHYPLAFLSAGILIELFSFLWPRGLFRAAGRWMILLGALLAVPALTAGMYAFRGAVSSGAAHPHMGTWYEVVRSSNWTSDQWYLMTRHVWLNSIGVAALVIGVASWVASTDLWRRRLYWPVMLVLIASMGLFTVGSWYSGEAVYRHGTAVELSPNHPTAARVGGESTSTDSNPPQRHAIKWYVPPLELHMVLAGIMVALSVGALALTLRRLERTPRSSEPPETIGPEEPTIGTPAPETVIAPDVITAPPAGSVTVRTYTTSVGPIHAGRFWLLGCFAAICTAVAGIWSVIDVFTTERLRRNWAQLTESDHRRLLAHTIVGVFLILVPLLLAALARFGRRRRALSSLFLAVLVILIGLQIWLGVAMVYDGHNGPLYRFNAAAAAQH
jgi:uncharacterized membrane protein